MKYLVSINFDFHDLSVLYSMVHHLRSGIEAVFAPDCTLILETAKLV